MTGPNQIPIDGAQTLIEAIEWAQERDDLHIGEVILDQREYERARQIRGPDRIHFSDGIAARHDGDGQWAT